ncbi:hypothetical protein EUGRSUZ_I02067 [Eucalyptus grandis]|uniref:Uncharacterized protein n=2 Tax=Eucalyptus grandis TaxID=71139 RepID=A0ACC3JI10_EUCGR|nr:hypothetical protein EUGRSUZ_I02067 [Eucalyptus grandis]
MSRSSVLLHRGCRWSSTEFLVGKSQQRKNMYLSMTTSSTDAAFLSFHSPNIQENNSKISLQLIHKQSTDKSSLEKEGSITVSTIWLIKMLMEGSSSTPENITLFKAPDTQESFTSSDGRNPAVGRSLNFDFRSNSSVGGKACGWKII